MALALVRLLFSFRGRIPRKQYWLAQSLLWVASLAGAWIIDGSAVLSSRTISPWLIGWNFILLFPELAVVVKRFNDRGRPIWLAAFWLGMTLSGLVAMSFGLFADPGQLGRLEWLLLAVFAIPGLWMFIDLGLLRGERGTNRHGADPLGAAGDAAPRPVRRTIGDNIRDGVTGLLIVIAVFALSGQTFGIPDLVHSTFRRLFMPEILQTWEEQHANAPAFEAQKEGDEAYRARDFEGAVSYFSRAIELYGPETRAAAKSYRNRADVLQRMGRMQDALSDFDEAIALEPTYAPGYRYRARLLIALDRYEDAIRDIASALQREPDSAATLVERGRLLEKMRRYDEASADFTQAIIVARSKYDQMIARSKDDRDRRYLIRARDDTIVDAYVNRANVFRSLNRIDEALLAYGQALELRPENRDAYMHRGWLYEKQGRFDLARTDYEKAATLGTPNDWLKRALERTR